MIRRRAQIVEKEETKAYENFIQHDSMPEMELGEHIKNNGAATEKEFGDTLP